ncbi:MAG TPA: hypothetical protein VK654_09065 [Nitrospirota bacterium]|nr:hypothetical protein [Nitrospirota bacterium]
MATAKDIKVNSYCDEVSGQLMRMKESIHELQKNAEKVYGVDSAWATTYDRHLCELADMIEWKLQILMKACPFEWAGTDSEYERIVEVPPTEEIMRSEFSGGYVGG